MSRNIEIKARVADLSSLEECVRKIADEGPFDLHQDDTFFACASGRLKLREFAPDRGELIFYRRPDRGGPKPSDYVIVPTGSPQAMLEALRRALGIVGCIRKHRRVYLIGQTRVHLDQVENLGSFLELEVVLRDDQDAAEGDRIATGLIDRLGISHHDLVAGAYVELFPRER